MKTVALIFVFAAILLLSHVSSFAQQVAYQSPAGTQFLLYTPASYSNPGNHPMLISLHGVDEIGDDITKLTNGGPLAPSRLIATNKWPASRPLLVLSPLLSSSVVGPDPEWPANYIDEVVQYVVANYRVDPNRIYITGLSRGGTGVWTYAAAYPNKIAGMVPISGVNDVSTACAIRDIPIWAFHGEADQVIQTFYPIDMANAINNCQPAAKFKPHVSLLEVREHTGWNEVYNESNGYPVFDWLLKFTKGSTTNTLPYVNAGADRQFLMRSGPLNIAGDYFDSDGTINNVLWTQTSGPAITLSNTDKKFLTLTNLQTGTFEFQLTVTDDDGTQSSDRVVITVLSTTTLPVPTDLVLVNGSTNTDIGNISEGQVINLTTQNLSQINIRAVSTGGSVRFSVNADQNTTTVSTSPYLIKPATSPKPEWEIKTGEYLVCATAYTGGSGTGTRGISQCFKITVTDGAQASTCNGLGQITREVWEGITGTNISDIPVATPPTFTRLTSIFETPTNIDDNYGTRVRGYVCPPSTGSYTFWIASNDKSELWLSTDEDPAHKVRIALVASVSGVRAWTATAAQQSVPITLQAGVRYYIEALHKEGIGSNDNLAVGWRLPNGAYERPIPGMRLIPYGSLNNNPTINITAPTAGQVFTAPASVVINANASANNGTISKVEFYNNTTKIGEDLTSPYSFTWTAVPVGSYPVIAKAIDSNGLSSQASVNIIVTTPPTVNITSPTAGQVFAAPASVVINATASASSGTISKVEFYNNTTKLGEDLTSPYSFTWNSVAVGSYPVIAKAIDSNGLSTTTAAVNITVSSPPTVNITSPTAGQVFAAPATVAIAATAAASNGTITKVEFYNNTTKIGEDLTAPYAFNWTPVPAGNYPVIAKAIDSNGLSTTTAAVNIIVAAPPTVNITSPTEGQDFAAPAAILIAATASASNGTITKVEFYNNTTKIGEDLTAPYSFNWTAVPVGSYPLIAKAIDSNGLSTSTAAVNVSVATSTPPTVNITNPTEGQSFLAPASIAIAATASATNGTITKVEFYNNTTKIGEDLTAPYSFNWTAVPVGSYPLIAKAIDSNGLSTSTAAVNVTVNTITPPTVNITSPTEGQTFPAPASVVISATASASNGTISKVEFYNNTILIGEDLTAPYSFNWTSVPEGNYLLIAKAIDSNGLSSQASVNIVVSSGSPTCTASGTIQRELWTGITGTAISSIPVGTAPTSTSVLTIFEGPTNVAENYGSRIRGYICVPSTGNYIFWIASNDYGELWLSTDNNPANRVKIASVTGYTSVRQWTKYPSQQSASIPLIAGQQYYIEALHKEATGSDNLAVGWQLPNGTLERPIPGIRLSPFGPSNNPPMVNITSPTAGQVFPVPASVVINATASDSDGTISKVEFYNNTTKLGEDLAAPYSFNWDAVPAGNYTVIAKATDNGGSSTSASVNIIVSDGSPTCTASGTIQRELWTNITGTAISSIPVNSTPVSIIDLTLFEGPTNVAENYGSRIRGYLCAPSTGSYTFWIASNDNSELWLSTNDNPANKVKIASVTGYCSVRQWEKYPTQRSLPISLTAGQRYYVEALHKEATGSDNLSVGWQLPNGTLERPIQGNRLSPFEGTTATAAREDVVLENIQEKMDVSVYPNPLTKSEFTIHVSGVRQPKENYATVEIASATGSKVFGKEIDCRDCSEIEVRMSRNLAPGIYMVYVVISGERFMKRLVVL